MTDDKDPIIGEESPRRRSGPHAPLPTAPGLGAASTSNPRTPAPEVFAEEDPARAPRAALLNCMSIWAPAWTMTV